MKIRISLKKSIYVILWAILLIPIYKPGYSSVSSVINNFYDVGRYVSILFTFIILIKYFFKIWKNVNLIYLCSIKFYIVAITFLFGVKNMDTLYSFILVALQCTLFTYMLKNNSERAIKAFLLTFEFVVYINLITLILNPEGMYNFGEDRIFTFFGHANNTLYFLLPLSTVAIIAFKNNLCNIRSIFDIFACILSILLVKSSTALVVYSFFIFVILYELKLGKRINIKLFTFFSLLLALSVGFIFFDIQSHFAYFIEQILHRELDFTGRTFYWQRNIFLISQSPIWGHGAVPGNIRLGGLAAHSFILESLFEGGIILLVLFISMFYLLSRYLDKNNKSVYARILFVAISSILITCISESNISNDVFFVLIIWGFNAEYFNLVGYQKKKQNLRKGGGGRKVGLKLTYIEKNVY